MASLKLKYRFIQFIQQFIRFYNREILTKCKDQDGISLIFAVEGAGLCTGQCPLGFCKIKGQCKTKCQNFVTGRCACPV